MAPELDHVSVERAYARWAPIYDTVFGTLFDTGREETIAAAARIGGRILDVGVGTGISLTKYPQTSRVIGIDSSEAMLRQAQRRMHAQRLTHIDALLLMDAEHLAFADATFDVSIAQYVITAVPKPEAVLDELARVTRAGGEILLVNHLAAETGPLRLVEKRFARITGRLGWSLNFDWKRLLAWMIRHGGVQLLERRLIAPLGQFSFVRLKREADCRSMANKDNDRIRFGPDHKVDLTDPLFVKAPA